MIAQLGEAYYWKFGAGWYKMKVLETRVPYTSMDRQRHYNGVRLCVEPYNDKCLSDKVSEIVWPDDVLQREATKKKPPKT